MIPRALKYGVGGIFFLLPLFLMPGVAPFSAINQLTGAKLFLCFLLGNAFFAFYLGKKIHPYFSLIHLTLALGAALLFNPQGSTYLYTLAYWSAAVGVALFFLELDEEFQEFLLLSVVYGAVASSVLGLFQAVDMDPILSYAPTIDKANRTLPVGLFGQTTKHGAFLAMALGIALGLRQGVAAAIIFVVALLTKSSFTYLAVAGVFVVHARYLPMGKYLVRGLVVLGVGASFLLYLLAPSLFVSHGRFLVWDAAIRAWWNGPRFFGFGPGSFEAIFPSLFQPKSLNYGSFIQAHNDYVQVVFEYGWVGVLCLVAGFFFVGKHFLESWWRLEDPEEKSPVKAACEYGLVAILLNAIGNFPFQLAPQFLLAVIFLAVLLHGKQEGYNKA